MVDFDGHLPVFYHPHLPEKMPTWAYAVALVFETGDELQCATKRKRWRRASVAPKHAIFAALPVRRPFFTISGEKVQWQWSRL
jgi:hypothetical protein